MRKLTISGIEMMVCYEIDYGRASNDRFVPDDNPTVKIHGVEIEGHEVMNLLKESVIEQIREELFIL